MKSWVQELAARTLDLRVRCAFRADQERCFSLGDFLCATLGGISLPFSTAARYLTFSINPDVGCGRSRRADSGSKRCGIDTPKLDAYLTRLTGVGRFDSASYGLTQNDGEVGLLITVHEKNYAPPVLQPAFAVNGTEPDNISFTMGGRSTFLDIAGYGSELRTDFSFGNTYGISTEFYKRFSQTSQWFFAPRVSASDSAQWIFSHSNPQADYRLGEAEFRTDLGSQ